MVALSRAELSMGSQWTLEPVDRFAQSTSHCLSQLSSSVSQRTMHRLHIW
jgi:hypothetical protein